MTDDKPKANPWPLIIEAGVATAIVYAIFGYRFPTWAWAGYAVFATTVVINESYSRVAQDYGRNYRKVQAFLTVGILVAVVASAVVNGSWWMLLFAAVLVWLWLGDIKELLRTNL